MSAFFRDGGILVTRRQPKSHLEAGRPTDPVWPAFCPTTRESTAGAGLAGEPVMTPLRRTRTLGRRRRASRRSRRMRLPPPATGRWHRATTRRNRTIQATKRPQHTRASITRFLSSISLKKRKQFARQEKLNCKHQCLPKHRNFTFRVESCLQKMAPPSKGQA